jgi:hypothetical protein
MMPDHHEHLPGFPGERLVILRLDDVKEALIVGAYAFLFVASVFALALAIRQFRKVA